MKASFEQIQQSAREEWEGRIRDMVQEVFRKMDLVPRKDLELVGLPYGSVQT